MRTIIFLCFVLFACHKSDGSSNYAAAETNKQNKIIGEEISNPQKSPAVDLSCETEVCLHFMNHNKENLSFDIYMVNTVPVAGFQCDIPGIQIKDSNGGLLKANGFDASNNANRLLAFSMTGKIIPPGEGVLTTVQYESITVSEICLEGIVFAGQGGSKLTVTEVSCLSI